MEMFSFEEFHKEQKKRERRQKTKKFLNDALIFVDDHKEALGIVAGATIGLKKVAGSIMGTHKTNKRLKAERTHRDLEIYDHSTGSYLKLRRPMTADEKVIFAARCMTETKAAVLHDMGLLKG